MDGRPSDLNRAWTWLPNEIMDLCARYADDVLEGAAQGRWAQSQVVTTHDAYRRHDIWLEAKMAECVFAIESGFDPVLRLQWKPKIDPDYDLIVGEQLVDVKSTSVRGTALIWPWGKNDLFKGKNFDVLVLTKVNAERQFGCSYGWVTKREFWEKRKVAEEGHRLDVGTRYMEQRELNPIEDFYRIYVPERPVVYYCEACRNDGGMSFGSYGFGCSERNNVKGKWYCREHRERGAKENGATIRR